MNPFPLPASVRVIERDWLNANNIVLLHSSGDVLVDTGYVSRAQETLNLVQQPAYLGTQPLHLVVNTHCHSDYMGGNALLSRTYHCPIAVPAGEAPLIRCWDTRALWLDYSDQRAEPFEVAEEIQPRGLYQYGGLSWNAIAAPEHDMGAVVFYCEEEQLLISGDALWEFGFGVVLPDLTDSLAATRATLETLSTLKVNIVIPGHGKPFTSVPAALEHSFRRLEAFEADTLRMARHVLKMMLTFTLLDRGSLSMASLSSYLDSVPVYREYNAMYFGLTPQALADLLVNELERAGAVSRSEGLLVPGRAN